MQRIFQTENLHQHEVHIREAKETDIQSIQDLFTFVYGGNYPFVFASDPEVLRAEIAASNHYLWLVCECNSKLVSAMVFEFDSSQRLGKASGAVVLPEFRKTGIGTMMLQTGIEYLTKKHASIDVIYGTTRTVSEGPSKMVQGAGFHKVGLFPNAMEVENLEHLNLDVYLTDKALRHRRRKPYLFAPFYEFYQIARKHFNFERAYLVTERAPLKLSKDHMLFTVNKNQGEAATLFRHYKEQKRISNSFFPFHSPNWVLTLKEDRGTEIFVAFESHGKQACIVGYRTDQTNIHDLLESVAIALQKEGAAYVELLVDAYDYQLQQSAYTARFIPSAYFPAMHLNDDGLRDDYFVLSRTFRLLDFTSTVVTGDNMSFLQAYLRCYYNLYIEPLLGPQALAPRSLDQ